MLDITPESLKKIKKAVSAVLIAAIFMSPGYFPGSAEAAKKAAQKVSQTQASDMKDALITMSFPGAQLGYILQSLGKVYGANFSISAGAAAQVVTIEFKDTKFSDVLEMIKAAANVVIKEVYPNSYVVSLENEGSSDKDKTEQERTMKALENRLSNGIMKTFVLNYVGATDVSDTLNNILGESAKSVCSVAVLGENSNTSGSNSSSKSSDDENKMGEREYATIVVYAANSKIMDYITNVIKEIDKPKPMVEVEAVFVEVASNKNSDMGFDWSIMPDPIKFVESSIGSVFVQDPEENTPIYRKTTLGQIRRITGASAEVQLNMTEGNGRGRVLSNPRIRVMSGYTAGFISETQVPIMNKDSDGEIKTEYKNVGVNLDILPVVLDNDQIYLTVAPSVSSITDTVTLGDTKAPQIASRSAETTVLMRDGETMVIGGLLSDRDIKSMNKVPILWKIPLLGELFKSESKTKEHSSISVYIRVKLIKDYMNAQTETNLPDEQIEKLLTAHRPKTAVVNTGGKTSGSLHETVNVEGVIPVAMTDGGRNKKKVTAEIVPQSETAPKSGAKAVSGQAQQCAKDTPAAEKPVKAADAVKPDSVKADTVKTPEVKASEVKTPEVPKPAAEGNTPGVKAPSQEQDVAAVPAAEAVKTDGQKEAQAVKQEKQTPAEEKNAEKTPAAPVQNADVSGYLY